MAAEARTAKLEGNEGVDALLDLETRITRAVAVISDLRRDNDALRAKLQDSDAQLNQLGTQHHDARALADEFQKENDDLTARLRHLSAELEALRDDRKQVKSRIEKLLSQLDLLGAD